MGRDITTDITDKGFEESLQKGMIAFVDVQLDSTDESHGTLNYLLKQHKEYKYLQVLAYEINPESIKNDATYQDFVANEKNLIEMIVFLTEDKVVIDIMMEDTSVNSCNYTEDVIELAKFIKSTQSINSDKK